MEISKYTFLFPADNEYYIYNTLSNALLKIDEDTYSLLERLQTEKAIIKKEDFNEELFDILEEKRSLSTRKVMLTSVGKSSGIKSMLSAN
jgi:uncharacterized protein